MSERLFAVLTRVAELDVAYPDRLELLWMAVGLKPAASYHPGELLLRSGHWTGPERLSLRQAEIDAPRVLELVDGVDAALLEAGWVTGRPVPKDLDAWMSGWHSCSVCGSRTRRSQPGARVARWPGLCATGSHNLLAVSPVALQRLLDVIDAPYENRNFGEVFGYPAASVAEYSRLQDRRGKTREENRRLEDELDVLHNGVPPELRHYCNFFIPVAEDLPLIAEARRRIIALFGEIPARLADTPDTQ